MKPKMNKRMVSKSEYAVSRGKKTSLSIFGMGTMLLGGSGLLLTCWGTISLTRSFFSERDWFGLVFVLIFIVVIGGGSAHLFNAGRKATKDAKLIDPGVPLTRANTANLPATESLVRASEEPLQEQEAVLLRAATEGQLTPPEQLVRAVEGQESVE